MSIKKKMIKMKANNIAINFSNLDNNTITKMAIDRILNHYNLKNPICFIDKKIYPRKQYTTKEQIKNGEFIIIDHKEEKEGKIKDKYRSTNLYRHIITATEEELDKYQLLCDKHNLMKHNFYLFYDKLSKNNNQYSKNIYVLYNKIFIYDIEKLSKELKNIDDNNAI